jgi:hypothetical protein
MGIAASHPARTPARVLAKPPKWGASFDAWQIAVRIAI